MEARFTNGIWGGGEEAGTVTATSTTPTATEGCERSVDRYQLTATATEEGGLGLLRTADSGLLATRSLQLGWCGGRG